MAVVTRKGGAITNRDASPRVLTNANIAKGMMQEAVATLETVSGDSIASVYIFASIPSNARVSQVLLWCDDVGTTAAADFGLYQSTENGSAVVDADFFASAVDLAGGALNAVDITHEAGGATSYNIDDAEKMVWEALGLTSDPGIYYDVAATLTAASDAAATITLKTKFAV